MRTSLLLSLFAVSALVLTGCGTKSGNGNGAGDDAYTAGDAGADVGMNPNDAAFDPNDPNVGAFASSGNFEDTRERVNDAGLATFYFTFDSYTLPSEELGKIEAAAQYLLDHPTYVMVLEGHCDERGSNEYNLSLSEQRALSVRDYMTSLGIDTNRLQTRAFGEEKPAVMGTDESAYSQNRRAEFVPYK